MLAVERTIEVVLIVLACLLFLAGPAVLIFQAYVWVREAAWMPLSALDGLIWAGSTHQWLFSPDDWLGIHAFLNWLPMSIALPILAVIPGYLYLAMEQSSPYK